MTVELAREVDLLTGAWKRERFEVELSKAVSETRKAQRPLALLWIDIDDLQEHNDLQGLETLDVALGWLAERLSDIIDGQGPICRVGGDEFGVFVRNCSAERALRLANRIRKTVPGTAHRSPTGEFRLTVSVGVAVLRRGEPWGNLVEAAQNACHRAKQGGRDAVVSR